VQKGSTQKKEGTMKDRAPEDLIEQPSVDEKLFEGLKFTILPILLLWVGIGSIIWIFVH
jgi:hypothetical protein